MSNREQNAERRLRLAEEGQRSAEAEYKRAIKNNLKTRERVATYIALQAARSKERAARIKLVRIQEESTSPSWAPYRISISSRPAPGLWAK